MEELSQSWRVNQTFKPNLPPEQVDSLRHFWQKAVGRAKDWAE
jgi:glycerol kinase